MIGQLLHNWNPRRTQSRQMNAPESVTEDIHTRGLLFPNATALQHPEDLPQPLSNGSPAGPFCAGNGLDTLQAGIDLDAERDIRIIVGQDESSRSPRTVLFDSRPPVSRAEAISHPSATKGVRISGAPTTPKTAPSSPHIRKTSNAPDPTTPRTLGAGAFHRAKARASSISSMPNIDQTINRPKEVDPVVSSCLDCMFGSTPMSYRGTGNKLHILPLEAKNTEQPTASQLFAEGRGSLPKGGGRKPSQLSRSYVPHPPSPEASRPSSNQSTAISKERKRTVLISRTFSVTLADEPSTCGVGNGNGNAIPPRDPNALPNIGTSLAGGAPQNRSLRRLPMYGISIILQLPVSSERPSSHTGPRGGGQDSLGSSAESDRRAGWSFIDSGFGLDSWLSASYTSDVDDRVDMIGQHWDVIIRSLTTLQHVVQEKIVSHFKAMDDAFMKSPAAVSALSSQNTVPQQQIILPSHRRNPRLETNIFVMDPDLARHVVVASERVARGIRIPRVMTGQNRWSVWREEARWLGRWAGNKEENFFFFTLVTAFLGHHSEWLSVLAPKKYRKLHRRQQKTKAGEDLAIANRTIIVSKDKMTARRLIFLLSAFMPASAHNFYDTSSPARPSTAISARGYSQSPPPFVAPSREQSLRRTINRRGRGSHSNMRHPSIGRGGSSSTIEAADERDTMELLEEPEQENSLRPQSRRPSLAPSTNTAVAIPAMSDASNTGRNGATTTQTVSPESAVPVPHFAVLRSPTGPSDGRPSSSESTASANLMNHLKRAPSGHQSHPSTDSSTSSTRWGSIMSFWSNGRSNSSTGQSDILQTTDEGLGMPGAGYRKPTAAERSPNKLQQMVQELELPEPAETGNQVSEVYTGLDGSPNSIVTNTPDVPASAARDIPQRPKPRETELKLSVNENDGIIDVDIPIPDFGSPTQSPLLPAFNSASSLAASSFGQASSMNSFASGEFESPINVAGWLGNKLHPDFALQSVNPYPDLDKEMRAAMSAEPTPESAITPITALSQPIEKWVDVCTTLIADTETFTVKRLKLRRLVRLIPAATQSAVTPGTPASKLSRYGNPYAQDQVQSLPASELYLKEKFVEEPVMDMDGTLVDAIERILVASGPNTRVPSASSSRSSSRRGRDRSNSGSDTIVPPVRPMAEVPRGECKHIVLGALEQIAKSVLSEKTGPTEGRVATPWKWIQRLKIDLQRREKEERERE